MSEQNNEGLHVPVIIISVGRHAVSKNNSFYVNAFKLECGQNLDPNQSIVACKCLLPFFPTYIFFDVRILLCICVAYLSHKLFYFRNNLIF